MAVSRPTVDDLIGWLKLQGAPDQATVDVLTEAFDAALDLIESRVNLPSGTTDDDYPQRVRTAIIITANRLYKRAGAPGGADIEGVVIVRAIDADVEVLISRVLKLDGFH